MDSSGWAVRAVVVASVVSFAIGIHLADYYRKPDIAAEQQITFSKEAEGICKVAGGGKTWLLVDMTQEFQLPEDVKAIEEEMKEQP